MHTDTTEKKPRKRGRPRIVGKLREPNGRISRAKNPSAKHALSMRAKHYGLTLEQAADPRAETHVGRLCLRGKENGLSEEQYEAALRFIKLRNDYQKTLLSPGAIYENSLSSRGRYDLNEYKKWVLRVQKRYKNALKAVEEAQFDNGQENLYAALQCVVIENQDFPHLLGATRMVLNALHRHFMKKEASLLEKSRPRIAISLGNMRHQIWQKEASLLHKKKPNALKKPLENGAASVWRPPLQTEGQTPPNRV